MPRRDYVMTRVQMLGISVFTDDDVSGRRQALAIVQGYLDHDEELEEERREAAEMNAERGVIADSDAITFYDSCFLVRHVTTGRPSLHDSPEAAQIKASGAEITELLPLPSRHSPG